MAARARRSTRPGAYLDHVTTLAIDIGGTKLAAALVADDGALTARRRSPTSADTTGEQLFASLVDLVDGVRADAAAADPILAVGVGCGGPMTEAGEEVSPINIPAWRSFPLRSRLHQHLGLPVHVDNDAKALALAEGWLGAAAGHRNFIAMVVSTGVGGGIVLDGRLLEGASGNAGHIGHVYVTDDSVGWDRHPAGLLETEASGTGIAVVTGRPAVEADAGVIRRTGTLVGRAVGSAANLLDLDLAVIGGSVALGFGRPFFEAAQTELDRVCGDLGFAAGTRIVPAGLGDAGPLVGAAAVALRAIGHDIGIR